jgi:hypothetical protein
MEPLGDGDGPGLREGNLQAPTRHPLDWRNPEFFDADALQKEEQRVFDICHGCRRCVSLCGAFPTLFDLVDESATMEVDGVAKADYWKVVDQCYLCDVCYMTKCPYVPPHPWNVDFPHLMLRAKAQRFRDRPVPTRDRLLTSTDAVGKLATIPVVVHAVNKANKLPVVRKADAGCARRGAGRVAAAVRVDALSLGRHAVIAVARFATARERRARWRSLRRVTSTTTSRRSGTTS